MRDLEPVSRPALPWLLQCCVPDDSSYRETWSAEACPPTAVAAVSGHLAPAQGARHLAVAPGAVHGGQAGALAWARPKPPTRRDGVSPVRGAPEGSGVRIGVAWAPLPGRRPRGRLPRAGRCPGARRGRAVSARLSTRVLLREDRSRKTPGVLSCGREASGGVTAEGCLSSSLAASGLTELPASAP